MKKIDLTVDLSKTPIESKSSVSYVANSQARPKTSTLILNGERMRLTSIRLNGKPLTRAEYRLSASTLQIHQVPTDQEFILETSSVLGENCDLFGLYETEGTVLVKAETEGLRRVFYCIDRPDVAAVYTTTILAYKNDYPVLLSNGIQIEAKDVDEQIHSVTWYDEVPKPSYLFALVAGKLERSVSNHRTSSGRIMPLIFYVPSGTTEQCVFAKEVLHKVIQWDEEVNQLQCTLPQQMLAAVDKYASGASETTGLNLFNTENLFATAKTKTDLGFLRVLEVVAHEWLHSKSGNETTIRDWCNLTFKEGLTTYRAARFCDFLFGPDLMRLLEGKNLDARAPRPNAYSAVRSLYTAAAYDKSAHIFRMMELVVGESQFTRAITEFLNKNTGNAVTVEDLLEALTQSTQKNLNAFLPWFTETGIPTVQMSDSYDIEHRRYTLKCTSSCAKNRPIPLDMGLIGAQGMELLAGRVLMLDSENKEFLFEDIPERPIPSLARNFSAPVFVEYPYSFEQLHTLLRYDPSVCSRAETSKRIIVNLVRDYCEDKPLVFSEDFLESYRLLLKDASLSFWVLSELLSIPSEEHLIDAFSEPILEKIAQGRALIHQYLSEQLESEWQALQEKLSQIPDKAQPMFSQFDMEDAGKRRLLSLCYSYQTRIVPNGLAKQLFQQFERSLGVHMTECTNALILLCELNAPEANKALEQFYEQWHEDSNAINYWFKIQSAMHSSTVVSRVSDLLRHPAFDLTNPNKVYALLNPFIKNIYGFHAASGLGYELVAQVVIQIDKINPPLAIKLTEPFLFWSRFDPRRQRLMQHFLKWIYEHAHSEDLKNATLMPPLRI